MTQELLKRFGIDLTPFIIDDKVDEYRIEDFIYDFQLALVKNEVDGWHEMYRDIIEKVLPDFEQIEEALLGTSYPTIQWIIHHKPTNTYYSIEGDAESWNDDGTFGERFVPLTQVYPQKKFITVYEKEPKLDSWS